MTGIAFHVVYKNRPGMSYVSTDMVHVAKDIVAMTNAGWKWEVSTITYVGADALSITKTIVDIWSMIDGMIPERYRSFISFKDGVLVYRTK